MSPEYPQYPQPTAPYNPQPFDINALLRLLGGTTPQSSTGGGGIGGSIGVTPPMPPRGGPVQPLPLASMPVGSVAPPQAPLRAVEDPYSTSTSKDFGFIGGTPPQAPQNTPQLPRTDDLDINRLMAALRAMQGRTTAPQAPSVPERLMPIEYTSNKGMYPNAGEMTDDQRRKMLENFMFSPEIPQMSPTESAMNRALRLARESEKARIEGGMPRMPSPTPVPQFEMGGRSNMGLGGILNAIRASRQR